MQLDDRYFQGLEGQYNFTLHFRVEKDGEQDYIVRSHGNYLMDRSVSVDIDLEPGTYSILMKIIAKRISYRQTPEQVIRDTCRDRQDKLIQIGLAYDLAHAKGQIKETEAEKKERLEREAKKKAADHQKRRKELRESMLKEWETGRKRVAREKRHVKRKEEHDKKAEARKAAAAPKPIQEAEGLSPDTAEKNATEAGDQAAKENSPGTTETIRQDTPATTDESPGESKPDATKPDDDKPQAAESAEDSVGVTEARVPEVKIDAPAETKGGVLEQQDDVATTKEGSKEESTTQPQAIEDTAAEDKAAQFEAALKNVPSDLADGAVAGGTAPGTAPVAGTAPPPSAAAADNNDWEYDSIASFPSSIVTELDLPPIPPEESAAPPANPDEEDENAEFGNDPWNAVCVVGLRVYSKDEGLVVSIVRPKSELDEDTPLDLDDNSKGASGETMKDGKQEVSTGETSQDKIETEVKEGGESEST